MSAITLFLVCAGCTIAGLVIGILMRISYIEKVDGDLMVAKKQLDDSPLVIECKLGQEMTLEQMKMEVVTPRIIQIMRHFKVALKDIPPISPYAEEIFKWYNTNSEYTKLVIVGYLRGGRVQIAWTWKKRDPVYICSREAINGYEDAIKAACENDPVLMYKKEQEESDDGRTETEKA